MIGKQQTTIMNLNHPQWSEFIERLEGPEGCNFAEDDSGKITWHCKGGYDKSLAIAILEKMNDVDIDGSVSFFNSRGGHCDCEILFNVAC